MPQRLVFNEERSRKRQKDTLSPLRIGLRTLGLARYFTAPRSTNWAKVSDDRKLVFFSPASMSFFRRTGSERLFSPSNGERSVTMNGRSLKEHANTEPGTILIWPVYKRNNFERFRTIWKSDSTYLFGYERKKALADIITLKCFVESCRGVQTPSELLVYCRGLVSLLGTLFDSRNSIPSRGRLLLSVLFIFDGCVLIKRS